MPTHTVLIADDETHLREVVCRWVQSIGWRTAEAATAPRALEQMNSLRADIAICSVNMSGPSGIWLASQLRERFPETAIIMAASTRDIEAALASLRNDAVDYLLKPFDRGRLYEAVTLARDWHAAAAESDQLHHALRQRLRRRRVSVAATVAQAQHSSADALEMLIALLQLHERDSRGHATRVARLSLALADQLGVDPAAADTLEQAALLHDIGKLDMPASILEKPAPLDDEEWEVMRTHPQVGYELLRDQPRFADAAALVWSHHECFDGSGYPRGLRGAEIPYGARILAVADAYDSMTQPHTQRPALPSALAVQEIERCSGRQFDPSCAGALDEVLGNAATMAA
jgi:putative nucleotidyltransferase with HDIG domain